jgi:hypothetical protein
MTTKNVLYLVAGAVALMGVWSLLATYAGFPSMGVTDPWWHAVLKVALGGFGLYVAYSDK